MRKELQWSPKSIEKKILCYMCCKRQQNRSKKKAGAIKRWSLPKMWLQKKPERPPVSSSRSQTKEIHYHHIKLLSKAFRTHRRGSKMRSFVRQLSRGTTRHKAHDHRRRKLVAIRGIAPRSPRYQHGTLLLSYMAKLATGDGVAPSTSSSRGWRSTTELPGNKKECSDALPWSVQV